VANQRKWSENILRVFVALGDHTKQKYVDQLAKKKFKAKVVVDFPFGACEFDAKVRIHGDQKDHLSWNGGKPIVSLDVSLDNGALANIRKFKLFLPDARHGDNELLITALLQSFGFLAPRTRYTQITLNGVSSTMIFQEKVAKEFLEEFGRREGPFFEGDERFLWGYGDSRLFSLEKISLGRLVNEKWAARGASSLMISLQGHALLQETYQNYITHVPESCGNGGIYLDRKVLANGNPRVEFDWNFFETIMMAANASHGLRPHNRKFFFNVLEQAHEPIYYDGSADFNETLDTSYIECQAPSFAQSYEAETFNRMIELISAIDRDKLFTKVTLAGYGGSVRDFHDALDQFQSNVELLASYLSDPNLQITAGQLNDQDDPLSDLQRNVNSVAGVGYAKVTNASPGENFSLEICPSNAGCDLVGTVKTGADASDVSETRELILDLLSGNKLANGKYETDHFVFWGFHNDRQTKAHQRYVIKNNLHLVTFGNVSHSFDNTKNELVIRLGDPDARALIPNSELSGTQIFVSGPNSAKPISLQTSEQRFNEYGLTGCLTIYRSSLKNVHIKGSGLMCEDGLNIISSSGTIRTLDFELSGSDAIDIDFSVVDVQNASVNTAGNDCLDVSGGDYSFGSLELSGCSDKGVSIGEKSTVTAENLNVEDTFIALSVKDSSVADLKLLTARSVVICAEARNKKQEFNGGLLTIQSLDCVSRPPLDEQRQYDGPLGQLRRDTRSAIRVEKTSRLIQEPVVFP